MDKKMYPRFGSPAEFPKKCRKCPRGDTADSFGLADARLLLGLRPVRFRGRFAQHAVDATAVNAEQSSGFGDVAVAADQRLSDQGLLRRLKIERQISIVFDFVSMEGD